MENLLFLGYEKTRSLFEVSHRRNGKGFLKMHVDSISTSDLLNNIEKDIFTYPINTSLEGFSRNSKGDELSLFVCNVDANLKFKLENDEKITEDILTKNSWFFDNFSHLVAKELLEKLLNNSAYKHVNIPISRFSDETQKTETEEIDSTK